MIKRRIVVQDFFCDTLSQLSVCMHTFYMELIELCFQKLCFEGLRVPLIDK